MHGGRIVTGDLGVGCALDFDHTHDGMRSALFIRFHERVPEQHFRRHNPKNPEQGGCKKDSGGKDRQALKEAALQLRKGWANLTNQHLERHGHTARVDHRSNKERGIASAPGRHLGQARIKRMKEAAEGPEPVCLPITEALTVLFLLFLAELAATAMDSAIIFAATHT